MRYARNGAAVSVWLLLASFTLSAQSAQFMREVALAEQLTVADAVYIVGIAVGIVPIDAPFDDAADYLARAGFRVPATPSDSPISLGEYAFLIAQAFDVRGGLMYGFFPGPRYALRELVYLGVLEPGVHTGEPVAGDSAVTILASAMETLGS